MGLVNLIIKLGLDRSAVSRGIKQGTMEWEQGQQKMAMASARFAGNFTRAWAVAIPAAMVAGFSSAFRSVLKLKEEAFTSGLSPTEMLKAQRLAAESGLSFEQWKQSIERSGSTIRSVIGDVGSNAALEKGVNVASDLSSGYAQAKLSWKAGFASALARAESDGSALDVFSVLQRAGRAGREKFQTEQALREFNSPTNPVFNTGGSTTDKSEEYLKEIRDMMIRTERARAVNSPGQFP